MSQIIENKQLIFAEIDKNSYKVYRLELHDDGTVISRFGRVGSGFQECNYGAIGQRGFDKKLASKYKKGYVESKTIDATAPVGNGKDVAKQDLATIALSQIKYSNPTLRSLITRLANANVHKITSSTNISYNETSGLFQTPLGVVTLEGITEARDLLGWFVKGDALKKINDDFKQKLNQYLRLIPRKTSHKLRVEEIFPDFSAIQKESDLLDTLESSYNLATTPKADDSKKDVKPVEQVFNLKLDILGNPAERNRIMAWYDKTNKAMHHYTHIKVREIYEIDIVDYNSGYNPVVGNVQEVFHGSGQGNILSIAKIGLRCAPPSTAAIAGKMFGNGVYGSQTVSKALGYTLGRWGQTSGDTGWIFVCDFAMGNPYYPTGATSNIPKEYHSCWALPAKTGLLNDELIVYRENQIRIKYLLECK